MVRFKSEIAKKIFAELDKNPNLTPKALSQMFNCPTGTAASNKNRWKRARKIPVGSKTHPIKTTRHSVIVGGSPSNMEESHPIKTTRPAESPIEKEEEKVPPTPIAIADSLLNRVIGYLRDYDTLITENRELHQYKDQVLDLEKQLRKVTGEKDRILKIHNEQSERGQFTSSEEVLKLARL